MTSGEAVYFQAPCMMCFAPTPNGLKVDRACMFCNRVRCGIRRACAWMVKHQHNKRPCSLCVPQWAIFNFMMFKVQFTARQTDPAGQAGKEGLLPQQESVPRPPCLCSMNKGDMGLISMSHLSSLTHRHPFFIFCFGVFQTLLLTPTAQFLFCMH